MKTFPCWVVDVRHERQSGVLGHFRSRPMTLTEARACALQYEATGTPVSLRCIEELSDLHLAIIHGRISWDAAVRSAADFGYDL